MSAPAGYGKTTLAAEWIVHLQSEIRNSKPRISWLSLDSADNEPVRFYRYFLAACQPRDAALQEQVQSQRDIPNESPSASRLDGLINDLAAMDVPLVLVLDDYHLIDTPQIHQSLEYFLDHQPATTYLVLLTRADPPLPLARWRTRDQMIELRARDLRFTVEEARAFLGFANISLAENALSALDERTEGWVAGLQLAALALQNQTDPAAFIETFRGSHRYVLDYLAGEVIQQQNEETRAFLTQTSLLDRFNVELCNALTGRDDSQAVIARLEQSNHFIIPLDNERRWYRYHHLFADYLNTLLSKSERVRLYKAAAGWHAANGMMSDAIHYALASADFDFTVDILEQALKSATTWSDFDLSLFSSWLDALPARLLQGRPDLLLNASRITYLARHFELAEKYIDQAEQALGNMPVTIETEQLHALATLYRGSIASVRGDFRQAIAQIVFAQERLHSENHMAHSRALFGLGLAYKLAGKTELAVQNYLCAVDEARAAGVDFIVVHGLCNVVQVQMTQGQIRLAEQTCQQALQYAQEAGRAHVGLPLTLLGGLALERNELVTAERLLQDGLAISRNGGLTDDVILGTTFLARLRVAQGDTSSALATMQNAHVITQAQGIPRLSMLTSAHLARIHLCTGQKQAAAHWAFAYQSTHADYLREFEELTLARILLATGAAARLPDILHPLLEKAQEAGRQQTCLEAMLLFGLYHRAHGDTAAALDWMKKSLELAAPENYIRLFLDEGRPAMELVSRLRAVAPSLVASICHAQQASAEFHATLLDGLPDPLSEQERRVLTLIVAGKSNAEIAAELVITVGTAKWHVHNILQKLGASNRPQAIARARELGV
jgi:LuxR family maltose regulon positive regulatory protein